MILGYPQPGKAKSFNVVQAFMDGCGGRIAKQTTALESGGACFFGCVGIEHLFRLAIAEEREFYYGDNSFFDVSRGRYFRFARNAVQIVRRAPPAPGRLKALGVHVKPWKRDGRHVVLVEQSEHFLGLVGAKHWLLRTLTEIKERTDRPLVIRRWNRDKTCASATLQADLRNAWALITHMSAAANEALLAGVPVFVSGLCAASPMASGQLSEIERPRYPEDREEWAAGLAGMQWTLAEMRSGMAWEALNP